MNADTVAGDAWVQRIVVLSAVLGAVAASLIGLQEPDLLVLAVGLFAVCLIPVWSVRDGRHVRAVAAVSAFVLLLAGIVLALAGGFLFLPSGVLLVVAATRA